MNNVVWSKRALAHLSGIRSYIAQFHPTAAQEIALHLVESGNSLQSFPHRGRPVPGTNKRELVTIYPYVIRYRIAGDDVRILSVRHGSRRQA